jgi:hypothetical protein
MVDKWVDIWRCTAGSLHRGSISILCLPRDQPALPIVRAA